MGGVEIPLKTPNYKQELLEFIEFQYLLDGKC